MSENRECPFCAESIKKIAKVFRFCDKQVIPFYVADVNANSQIVTILDLYDSGQSVEEIAQYLNENGVTRLDSSDPWESEKVTAIISSFKNSEKVDEPKENKPSISAGAISCPKCSNASHGSRGCLIWFFVILLFPVGLLFLLLKPTYKCGSCGYTFKS